MTVKQLREALKKLGKGHDSKEVVIWLPGSKIDLQSSMFLMDGNVMIEGNLRAGSALER